MEYYCFDVFQFIISKSNIKNNHSILSRIKDIAFFLEASGILVINIILLPQHLSACYRQYFLLHAAHFKVDRYWQYLHELHDILSYLYVSSNYSTASKVNLSRALFRLAYYVATIFEYSFFIYVRGNCTNQWFIFLFQRLPFINHSQHSTGGL